MLIIGLGNPGIQYRYTRHNAGYLFVNQLARTYRRRFRNKAGNRITTICIRGSDVIIIKSRYWMNQSGLVLSEFRPGKYKRLLVVLDDLNLPLGRIRLRKKGSDGGHLGLRSIIEAMQSSYIMRLRIGIGYPEEDATSYVLSNFKKEEKELLKKVIKQGIKGIEILIQKGFTRAQNYINGIDLTVKSAANSNRYNLRL